MGAALRGFWAAFWQLVDGDSVRPFIPVYYIPLLLWGIYAVLWAEPISVLQPIVSGWAYGLWEWMPIPGTLTCMAGLWLRHGGSPLADMTRPLLRQDWLGLWMQTVSHACMCLVLLAYVVATIAGAYWGQPIISTFALSSYVFGTAMLTLQCARKIRRGFQLNDLP